MGKKYKPNAFIFSAIVLSCLSFILAVTTQIHAAGPTYHSGNITSDETWYEPDSPHIVTGDVSVLNGAKLTIEPGCTLKFNTGVMMHIGDSSDSGSLDAPYLYPHLILNTGGG